MKILFLDVDGILNNGYYGFSLLPSKIKQLKTFIDKNKYKIVLISTWRLFPQKIQKLKDSGLVIYDYANTIVSIDLLKKIGFSEETIYRIYEDNTTPDKGALVAEWLYKHKNKKIEHFLILDDNIQDIDNYFPDNHITKIEMLAKYQNVN